MASANLKEIDYEIDPGPPADYWAMDFLRLDKIIKVLINTVIPQNDEGRFIFEAILQGMEEEKIAFNDAFGFVEAGKPLNVDIDMPSFFHWLKDNPDTFTRFDIYLGILGRDIPNAWRSRIAALPCPSVGLEPFTVDELDSVLEEEETPQAEPQDSLSECNGFVKNGNGWAIRYNGKVSHLKSYKGLGYIHTLLSLYSNKGEYITPEAGRGDTSDDSNETRSNLVPDFSKGIRSLDLATGFSNGFEDSEYDPEYDGHKGFEAETTITPESAILLRDQIDDLKGQIEELGEPLPGSKEEKTLATKKFELEECEKYWNEMVDLKGNPRIFLSPEDEKASSRVRNAIDRAIDKIKEVDPECGEHLDDNIKTGYRCGYKIADRVIDKPGGKVHVLADNGRIPWAV